MSTATAVRVRSPRTYTTSGVQRRERADARPLPAGLGSLAGTDRPHEFAGMDATQCAECFGWRDDPRHPVTGGPVVGR